MAPAHFVSSTVDTDWLPRGETPVLTPRTFDATGHSLPRPQKWFIWRIICLKVGKLYKQLKPGIHLRASATKLSYSAVQKLELPGKGSRLNTTLVQNVANPTEFGGVYGWIRFFWGGGMSGHLRCLIILLCVWWSCWHSWWCPLCCSTLSCFNADAHESLKSDYRLTTGANSDFTNEWHFIFISYTYGQWLSRSLKKEILRTAEVVWN